MTNSIPIVSLAALAPNPREVAAALGRACRTIGFFYVSDHGIPDDLTAGVFSQAGEFFALPEARKSDLTITRSRNNRGYVAMEGESLDPNVAPDLKEAFNIGRDPEPGESDAGANQWPASAPFRETMQAYFAAQLALCRSLHRAFALDLGLDPDFFRPYLTHPMATLRLLHYPAQQKRIDGQIGAGAHTDYGNITILAQDMVGGLQVRTRQGDWIDATPMANTFVCNIGDCLMRWSNDVYVSTPHRVVNSSGRQRYSVAFFCDPNTDAPVECLPGCVAPGETPRYPPISAGEYLRQRLDATYKFHQSDQTEPA